MIAAVAALSALAAACNQQEEGAGGNVPAATVTTSGKSEVAIADIPPAVLAAVKQAQPDLSVSSAEAEMRDGRSYFDIGGTLADGSEIEFDVMKDGEGWRVVETQRDIAFGAAPEPVRSALQAHDAAFKPTRIIESRQEDGVVIFEFFAVKGSDPQGRKAEVKWEGGKASILDEEWAH